MGRTARLYILRMFRAEGTPKPSLRIPAFTGRLHRPVRTAALRIPPNGLHPLEPCHPKGVPPLNPAQRLPPLEPAQGTPLIPQSRFPLPGKPAVAYLSE